MTDNKNQNKQHSGPKLNDQMLIRREKLEKIRALGVEPYGQKFDWDHHAADIRKEAETLEKEYKRDLAAGKPIQMPKNYYPGDDASLPPPLTWRAHGSLLFANWLNYFVYQETPYDIGAITEQRHK